HRQAFLAGSAGPLAACPPGSADPVLPRRNRRRSRWRTLSAPPERPPESSIPPASVRPETRVTAIRASSRTSDAAPAASLPSLEWFPVAALYEQMRVLGHSAGHAGGMSFHRGFSGIGAVRRGARGPSAGRRPTVGLRRRARHPGRVPPTYERQGWGFGRG